LWKKVGELGKAQGLEWAGDWKKFKELAHFQFTGGLTLADFQEGKTL
jgi:peptidoglycan L-alanyl-D-glutamate endopeptidase CwlK